MSERKGTSVMQRFAEAEQIAREAGFLHTAFLEGSAIELLPEVRRMCEADTCGQYGKNWSCPPVCGELSVCRERIGEYSWGILVQTVGELEDSMDIEGMLDAEKRHKERFQKAAEGLREAFPNLLPLGTGACTICGSCACPETPCRFPEKRISSMEAYGIPVSELCRKNNMKYYYGPGTVSYTGCFLLGKGEQL